MGFVGKRPHPPGCLSEVASFVMEAHGGVGVVHPVSFATSVEELGPSRTSLVAVGDA